MPLRRRLFITAGLPLGPAWAAGPGFDLKTQGLVVMLRHAATEPGVGDPPGYTLGDCSSQRQLSAEGRAQARRLGPMLAAQGLKPGRVLSSRWCRCLDTARLAFGEVSPWPALDSFFDQRENEPGQTARLRTALQALQPGEVQAWVTHMVNIAALTGAGAGMGEAVVLAGGPAAAGQASVKVLARLALP